MTFYWSWWSLQLANVTISRCFTSANNRRAPISSCGAAAVVAAARVADWSSLQSSVRDDARVARQSLLRLIKCAYFLHRAGTAAAPLAVASRPARWHMHRCMEVELQLRRFISCVLRLSLQLLQLAASNHAECVDRSVCWDCSTNSAAASAGVCQRHARLS